MSEVDWIMNKKWSANKVCADEFNALVSTSQKVVKQLQAQLAKHRKGEAELAGALKQIKGEAYTLTSNELVDFIEQALEKYKSK